MQEHCCLEVRSLNNLISALQTLLFINEQNSMSKNFLVKCEGKKRSSEGYQKRMDVSMVSGMTEKRVQNCEQEKKSEKMMI